MSITTQSTGFGISCQPHTVCLFCYGAEMDDCKKILWENVSLLMHQHYGKENLTQCAEDSGVGPGTMSRIKAQETSVGIDTIEKLATLFKVQTYELMIPNLNNQEVVVVKS